MTKFKGLIMGRKLEADQPNCPSVPIGAGQFAHDSVGGGEIWNKQMTFVTPQVPQTNGTVTDSRILQAQYRQPWDHLTSSHNGLNNNNGINGGTPTAQPSAPSSTAADDNIPQDLHLPSPTSSAFTSASDSTPSTLVLATLKKRKRKPQPIPEDCKDDAYWERRKRNNESAKRSREMRRIKEQQTTMRVIYLEQENLRLKTESDMLRGELEKLREILYNGNRTSLQNGNGNAV